MTQFDSVIKDVRQGITQLTEFLAKRDEIRLKIDTMHNEQVTKHDNDIAHAENLLGEYQALLAALNVPEVELDSEASTTEQSSI